MLPRVENPKSRWVSGLVLWFLISGCGGISDPGRSEESDRSVTVALVNSKVIRLGELRDEVDRFRGRLPLTESRSEEGRRNLTRTILEQMVQSEILYQVALERGIRIDPAELEQEIANLIGDLSKTKLQLVLGKAGLEFSEWKDRIEKNLMIQKLIREEVDQKIKVKNFEMKSHFKKNGDRYVVPEEVHAYQIVVASESEAHILRKSLVQGEDFVTVARESSLSPDAKQGGDLGFFSEGQLPQEFDEVVFNLNADEISEVVQSPYGFHLFKVAERRPARKMSFEEAKPLIQQELTLEKREEMFKEWVAELRRAARVVVYEERI
jgi:parvulin-like peptidyl-prolyl isomerase